MIYDCACQLDDMPTINHEITQAVRGSWVCINKAYGEHKCTACGGIDSDCSGYYGAHNVTEQEYCPNCGARMGYREPSEEEKRQMEKEALDIVGEMFGED